MGGSSSKPEETPLDCILKNWKFKKTDGLKREKLKLYSNTAWPLYKLGEWRKTVKEELYVQTQNMPSLFYMPMQLSGKKGDFYRTF